MSKLTHEDRIKIEALHNAGLSASKIANELGKHRSTITREIARNTKDGAYGVSKYFMTKFIFFILSTYLIQIYSNEIRKHIKMKYIL